MCMIWTFVQTGMLRLGIWVSTLIQLLFELDIFLISGSYEVIKSRDRYFTIDDMTEQLPNMETIDNAYF